MSIIKNYIDYINALNEGLIKTYPGDIVLKDIVNSLTQMGLNVRGEFKDDKIILSINDFNVIPLNKIEILFDHMMTFIVNRGGWFPSTMNLIKLSGKAKNNKYDFHNIIIIHDELDSVEITYESKYDEIESDVPSKLYHLTIKEYEKKINKSGLIPRSKSKLSSHLDRIYVCKTIKDCEDLIPKMMFHYTGEKDSEIYKKGKKLFNKDIEPIIYEIDNSDNSIEKLYIDINYSSGYYLLDNIKANKLTKI
jgi:hypothetical protein